MIFKHFSYLLLHKTLGLQGLVWGFEFEQLYKDVKFSTYCLHFEKYEFADRIIKRGRWVASLT